MNHTMKKTVLFILIPLAVLLVIWIAVCAVDFAVISGFNKPLFCVNIQPGDDGVSGRYVGIGYTVDISGAFLSEDEPFDIDAYDYNFLGIWAGGGRRCGTAQFS